MGRVSKVGFVEPGQFSLGEGLLRERFDYNRIRIASLSTDGLLKRYRERKGLPAPGRYLSAWDQGKGICGAGGEYLGHWLSAASIICAWDRDASLYSRLEAVVAALKDCADSDGYVSTTAIPEDFQRYTHNFYRFDKLLGGLLDSYAVTHDGDLLHLATGTANRFQVYLDTLTSEQVADRLTSVWKDEAHGMLDNLVWLYEMTGEKKYLDFAHRLEVRSLRNALVADQDVLTGRHAYSHTLLFCGYVRMYEITRDTSYLTAAMRAWEMIEKRTYVTGGSGDGCGPAHYEGEAWRRPYELPLNHQTQETCQSYAWMRLCVYLFRHTGDVKMLDMLERTLYNHILSCQNPWCGDWAYWLPLDDRARKIFGYCWNDPNFRLDGQLCGKFYCCDGTGTRALAEMTRWVFLCDQEGLLVNLYVNAQTVWQAVDGKSVLVVVQTDYPFSEDIQFRVSAPFPTRMKLRFRIPMWLSEKALLQVNNEAVHIPMHPGSLASLDRVWVGTEHVHLRLPFSLRFEELKGDPSRVALVYGPLVLAGVLSRDTEVRLPGTPEEMGAWLSPVPDQPGVFTAGTHLHFRPLMSVTCEPYNVYFPLE